MDFLSIRITEQSVIAVESSLGKADRAFRPPNLRMVRRQVPRSNQTIGVCGISVVVCERSAGATSTAASIARSRAALGSVAADSARSGKSSSGNDMALVQNVVSQPGSTENCAVVLTFAGSILEEIKRYPTEISSPSLGAFAQRDICSCCTTADKTDRTILLVISFPVSRKGSL